MFMSQFAMFMYESALSIEGNTEALRLIIRMAAMRKQEILNLKLTVGIPKHPLCGRSNTFSHMLSLEAPTGSIDADSLQDILNVAQVLESLLEDAAIPLNSEDINHMLLATQSNAHRITDTEKKCVGLGAFPFISMLNHSCCPNCSHHFVVEKGSPPILVMQAIDDIDVGDELCYNYVPLYQSTERRRGLLNSAYSFTCDCRRCLQASSESHAESVFSPSIFPCDSILSALDFAVNKKLSSLNCEENKVTLDFINAVPCDEESFHKVTAEISMCNNLMASAASNSKACKSIIKKLVKMFGDELKAGTIHPCHELVLNAYVTCARGCCSLLTQEKVLNTDEKLDIAKICVGMGGLALGCIIKYTRVRNDDIADLERMIGIAMQSLTNTEVSCNAQDFSSLFVRAAHEALVAMNYFWASEPVVSDLLAVATTYASVVCSDDDPMSLSQAFLKSSDISNLKR